MIMRMVLHVQMGKLILKGMCTEIKITITIIINGAFILKSKGNQDYNI